MESHAPSLDFRILAVMLAGLFLLSTSGAAAKKHEWQDGTVVKVTPDAPGVTAPAAETVYGYQIKRAYYWIKVGKITYVLANSWTVGFDSPKAPLNVTVNGKIKIAIEGRNAFILDDAGKEIERPIVAKIADPEESPTNNRE